MVLWRSMTTSNSLTEVKWGFLGCGSVTESTSGPAFGRIANSTVHAIMRRTLPRAKLSAERLGAKKWYDSVDMLVNDPEVDAIYIATPPGCHLDHALACCRAKKPAYIEKPFARNFTEATAITDAFEREHVPLFVAHYRRALPRFLELKRIIDSGEIGIVRDVHVRLMRRFADDKDHPWLFSPELSGGGKFFDIAPHTIDLLVFLFGLFQNVHGNAITTKDARHLEDVVVFSFETSTHVLGTANFNLVADTKKDELRIYGSLGSVSATIHGDPPYVIRGISGDREVAIRNPTYIEQPMIEEVVKFLLGSQASPCFGREALETYRIIDIILSDFYGGRDGAFWTRRK